MEVLACGACAEQMVYAAGVQGDCAVTGNAASGHEQDGAARDLGVVNVPHSSSVWVTERRALGSARRLARQTRRDDVAQRVESGAKEDRTRAPSQRLPVLPSAKRRSSRGRRLERT